MTCELFTLNSSNDNSESNNSSRGCVYNNTSSRGRQHTAPSHQSNSNGHLERPSKGSHGKAAMQTTPVLHKGQDSPTAQLGNRKGRGAKAQNQSQQQNQSQGQTAQDSSQRRCSDDSDYSSLVEAMDRDLDRPESPATTEVFHEQAPLVQATQGKGMLTNR